MKPQSVASAENTTERKAKTGRPLGATKLQFSDEIVKQIEGLARIQCTMREAGAVLGVNEVTFSRFLQAHGKALAAWEHGKEQGKASLRRNQYRMAENNPTMAIWLGKQMLGQKDRHELSGDAENPVRYVITTGVPREPAEAADVDDTPMKLAAVNGHARGH